MRLDTIGSKTKAGGHEVLSISPLEFLNLHQCEKNQNENPYGLCLNVLKTLVGPFCKEKVHVSAFSQYFVYGCQYRKTLISTVMRPVCKLLCAEARVSPGPMCPLCSADNWDNAAHHILLGAFLFWQSRWHQCSAQ